MVAQTSAATSRRAGFVAALGMGCAAALLASVALLGLHALLVSSVWFERGLRLLGGAYLLYLGCSIWRSASKPLNLDPRAGPDGSRLSFWMAVGTMLSNPKAAIQYGVIFAAFLPSEISIWFGCAIVSLVFLLEAGWYSIVAFALSSGVPRNFYIERKSIIDKVFGAVMCLLGLKLTLSVHLS